MLKVSLFEKLIIAFMLLSMGAIGVVGLYSYRSARTAQMARTYDQLASVRYLKKKQVEAFYSERQNDLRSLVREPAIRILLSGQHNTKTTPSLSPVMTDILRNRGLYKSILLIRGDLMSSYTPDKEGRLQLNSNKKQAAPGPGTEAVKGNGKPFITDLLPDSAGKGWTQRILIRVHADKPENEAVVALELFSSAIDSIMPDHNPLNGLGKSGEAYLVGKDRQLRSSSRFINQSVLRASIDTSTARLAFGGSEGTWLLKDYRGVEVLGSFSKLSPACPDWAIIAEIDMGEALVPILSIRNNILFITVFIAVIVFLATWFLSRKITDPVLKLRKAALELGKGKLGTRVDVNTGDEIGELAETFNLMSEQLQEKDLELQQERNLRMRAAFDGQDSERQRLSRELHDGLGQSLIAQKLRLESIQLSNTGKSAEMLDELKTCSDQLVDEVRRISNALMPAQLTLFGLVSALKQHCDEVSRFSNTEVSFEATGNFELESRKTKTYLFRIVQEALNNIVKHAEARSAMVEIAQTRENIFLSISDDGHGFSPETASPGNGLNNMRERTRLLNGSFAVSSQPGTGTTIEIQIPLSG